MMCSECDFCNANSYPNVNLAHYLLVLIVLQNFENRQFFHQIDQACLEGYKQIRGFQHSFLVTKDKGLQPYYSYKCYGSCSNDCLPTFKSSMG